MPGSCGRRPAVDAATAWLRRQSRRLRVSRTGLQLKSGARRPSRRREEREHEQLACRGFCLWRRAGIRPGNRGGIQATPDSETCSPAVRGSLRQQTRRQRQRRFGRVGGSRSGRKRLGASAGTRCGTRLRRRLRRHFWPSWAYGQRVCALAAEWAEPSSGCAVASGRRDEYAGAQGSDGVPKRPRSSSGRHCGAGDEAGLTGRAATRWRAGWRAT